MKCGLTRISARSPLEVRVETVAFLSRFSGLLGTREPGEFLLGELGFFNYFIDLAWERNHRRNGRSFLDMLGRKNDSLATFDNFWLGRTMGFRSKFHSRNTLRHSGKTWWRRRLVVGHGDSCRTVSIACSQTRRLEKMKTQERTVTMMDSDFFLKTARNMVEKDEHHSEVVVFRPITITTTKKQTTEKGQFLFLGMENQILWSQSNRTEISPFRRHHVRLRPQPQIPHTSQSTWWWVCSNRQQTKRTRKATISKKEIREIVVWWRVQDWLRTRKACLIEDCDGAYALNLLVGRTHSMETIDQHGNNEDCSFPSFHDSVGFLSSHNSLHIASEKCWKGTLPVSINFMGNFQRRIS